MIDFELESLLRSQNIQMVQAEMRLGLSHECDETMMWEDDSGPLKVYCVRSDNSTFYRLRMGDEIAVDVMSDNSLAVLPCPDIPQITVDHFIADQVVPRVLAQQAELVVHAGSIHDGDGAVLLLGPSGCGKSTLVTSFHLSGWAMMGDDALVLALADDHPIASAVYPSLRLFADSIDALFSAAVISHDVAHYSSKQRIDIRVGNDGSGSVRVKAMFVLGEDGPIGVSRLSIAEACMALVENSFALDPTDRDRARQRLDRASRLAATIPAFLLTFPRDFTRLAEVKETIVSAIGDGRALVH